MSTLTLLRAFLAPVGAGTAGAGAGLVWAGLACGLAMYTFLPALPGGLEWEKSVIKTIPSLVSTANGRVGKHDEDYNWTRCLFVCVT